jgi:hypothetical protein
MAFCHRIVAVYVALLLGGVLILATHLLTMRSVSNELEGWRSLGYTLTETAEQCVALLPAAWIANGVAKLNTEIQ